MRLIQILCEKTIIIPDAVGHNFVVTRNPTKSQYVRLVQDLDTDYKGLIDEKDFYLWPAWHAHHHEIANALGISEKAIRVFVFHNAIGAHPEYWDAIRQNAQMRFLFGTDGPTLVPE